MNGATRSRLTRWVTAVAACAFVLVGATLLVIGFRAQRHAPQPTRAAAGVLYRPQMTTTSTAAESSAAATSTTTSAPPVVVAEPAAIDIPAIGVHSTLIQLGLNSDRTIEVPVSFHVAGWYRLGARPGANGPAIIVGHVDSKSGPGIFYRLGAMRPGDRINVSRADGTNVAFTVTGVRSYTKAAFPSLAVYGNTPTPTIRLITCGGTFDAATGHYLSNVVVFGQQTNP